MTMRACSRVVFTSLLRTQPVVPFGHHARRTRYQRPWQFWRRSSTDTVVGKPYRSATERCMNGECHGRRYTEAGRTTRAEKVVRQLASHLEEVAQFVADALDVVPTAFAAAAQTATTSTGNRSRRRLTITTG